MRQATAGATELSRLGEMSIVICLYDFARDLLLRLRWIAILAGRLRASLALTGGVHDSRDAVKAVLAGADAVQIVSALLESGPTRLKTIREGFERWAAAHGYASVGDLRGRLSASRAAGTAASERSRYIETLQLWQGGTS